MYIRLCKNLYRLRINRTNQSPEEKKIASTFNDSFDSKLILFYSSHIKKQVQHAEFPVYRFVGLHQAIQKPTLCQYGVGLKFKDLLFSIYSKLNEVSQRGCSSKSFSTCLVAQKVPLTAHPLADDSRNKT